MSALGDIRYLAAVTRFDKSFASGRLAQFIQKPTMIHLDLLKNLVRYLRGTAQFELTYQNSSNIPIYSFSDSDYAESHDRHSISVSIHMSYGDPQSIGYEKINLQ